jgi:hypothetical protein
VSRKNLAGKELATSSDNEGSTERPAKKPRTASSASVMHVQPLHSDDDDGHNLLLSTLTGGHGVFMAEAEVDKIEDWYDSDNDWYDSDNTPSTKKCGLTSKLLAVRLSRPSPQQSPNCRNSAPVS